MGPPHEEGVAGGPADMERQSLQEGPERQFSVRLFGPGRKSGTELQCHHFGVPADLSDGYLQRAPRRQHLGRKLGTESSSQGRDDSRRSAMDQHPHVLLDALTLDEELKKYKLVDTDGQAFADAALSEREDNRQLGANNFWLAPHFIK